MENIKKHFKQALTGIMAAVIVLSSSGIAGAVKINKADTVQKYDEMKRQEIGVGVEAGIYNLAGTQLKGLQYAGMMNIQDRILWEESVKELLQDMRNKTTIDMKLLDKVEYTISPYRFNGLAGLTHTAKDRFNIILSQDIKGIPDANFRKQVMKETIAHEIGHVIFKQVNIEDTYREMVGNGNRRTSTPNMEMSQAQWAHHIEENFAEDVKVYIISSINKYDQGEEVTKKVVNNTAFSANKGEMSTLMQKNAARPAPMTRVVATETKKVENRAPATTAPRPAPNRRVRSIAPRTMPVRTSNKVKEDAKKNDVNTNSYIDGTILGE